MRAHVIAGLIVISAATACSNSTAAPTPSATSTVPTRATATATTTEVTPIVVSPPASLPAGYPKVVAVRSLPHQVRNWYELKGTTQAVQLAPGVWTSLPVGATTDDAVNTGVLDGFCASIKAFEREYRNGQSHAGTCW